MGSEGFQYEMVDENGMFKPDMVKSDFLKAYALLRSDTGYYGEDYVKAANPEFLGRTIKGIVQLRFAFSKNTIGKRHEQTKRNSSEKHT